MNYDELVRKINKGMKTKQYHEMFVGSPELELKEVNAWTYWQGYDVRNPKILLVGQDWGSIALAENFKNIIDKINERKQHFNKVMYFEKQDKEKKEFDTDRNMAELFKILGYEDILHTMYDDLFFTNLIPGFRREGGSTGGFKAGWVTEEVKSDFRQLVDILKPQIIICLGQDTYKQAALSYGRKKVLKGKSLNCFLNEKQNPEIIKTDSGHITYMFCVAHPGFYGTFNRNGRTHIAGKKKLDEQIKDWKHIKKWMKNINSDIAR